MSKLAATHLRKSYKKRVVVDDVSLEINTGDVVRITSYNVCYTKLLRIVARGEPIRLGHDHPTVRQLEIEQLIKIVAIGLHKHVLAGETEIGRTILHIGGHVGGTDNNVITSYSIHYTKLYDADGWSVRRLYSSAAYRSAG